MSSPAQTGGIPAARLQEAAAFAEAQTGAAFQRYYAEAGPDYLAWSPAYNMHFGWWRAGLNPFRREAMLEEMNAQILERLSCTNQPLSAVLDMGCGLGATLRSLAQRLPDEVQLHGITLVPWQVQQGEALNKTRPKATEASRRIALTLGDYQNTSFPSASFDGIYALESSCYARGTDKAALLREAYRLLRPGGRLVLADGFLPFGGGLTGLQQHLYRKLCQCWVIESLGELDRVVEQMHSLGFHDIQVEAAQWRVALSVCHVPWVTLRFLIGNLLHGGGPLTRARWHNLLAPLLLPWVSQPLGPLGYYLVSATR